MRPAKFEYLRPSSLSEALSLLSDPEAKALAGGHSLIPAMNLRLAQPGKVIDVGRLEGLGEIRFEGSSLHVGALATHARIAASDAVRTHCPALAQAASLVGDPQVRNWGTLGGNLAHSDPASDPPTVVLAAGATIHVRSDGGERAVGADNFFVDLFATDLRQGELITSIEIPSQSGRKSAYLKLSHPASRYALVGVCAILDMDGPRCRSARIAIGGALPIVRRATDAENLLSGSSLDASTLETAAEATIGQFADDVMGDIHAPADYRRAMVGVYLKRAIRAALSD